MLKQATLSDLEHVMALYRACAKQPNSCWDDGYPTEELARNDLSAGTLYLYGDVGAATLLEWEDLENMQLGFAYTNRPCVLCRLCLSPQRQGRGEGKLLLAQAEETARALGYRCMHLLCDVDNPTARHLYEHAGYRTVNQAALFGSMYYAMEKAL